MILNVSGRTDIIAFYSEWFLNRYREGFVDVRNPFYEKQVSRIYFKDVEAIVFCTKNPIPFLDYMDQIKIPYIIQVTITPYHNDLEPGVGDKSKIIAAVQTIAKKIGKENVYIRYDPIFLNKKYNITYHQNAFIRLCSLLEHSTTHIIVSFLDYYQNVKKHLDDLQLQPFTEQDYQKIGISFSCTAKKYGMTVQTCSEEKNLVDYGFIKDDCVNTTLAYQLTGRSNFKRWKARNNKYCNCVEMVDIGAYNTCSHYCKYCYANFDESKILENRKNHIITSTMLVGTLEENDEIRTRKSN